MRVVLVGAGGRMGTMMRRALEESGDEVVAAVDLLPLELSCACYRDVSEVKESADVIVDFSNAGGTRALVAFAQKRRLPLVVATTGQSGEERELIQKAAEDIPVFFCGNLSFGVALFASLAGRVAAAFKYADVEIVETHNASKADSPSGTALMLADAVIKARGFGRIVRGERDCRALGDVGISSLRLGDRAGIHEVIFDTGLQQISLRHEVFGRELFARGAINAMRFLVGKPAGLYGIADISGLGADAFKK